mgnify:CR=1 FL=1
MHGQRNRKRPAAETSLYSKQYRHAGHRRCGSGLHKRLEIQICSQKLQLVWISEGEVKAGETIEADLTIDPRALTIVDEEGKRYVDSDEFSLYVGCTQPDERSVALTGCRPVEVRFTLGK